MRLTVVACALMLTGAAAPPADAPACFAAKQIPAPDIEVIQQAPPPSETAGPSYAFYPASAFATQSMSAMWGAHRMPYDLYYFQWSNRSTQGVTNPRGKLIERKGNFQPGWVGARDKRSNFTSTQKGDACTLAQSAFALGETRDVVEATYLKPAGVQLTKLDETSSAGLADASDVCVLPPRAAPPETAGVLLDYEVQDGRTPEYTLAFLSRFSRLVHAAHKKAILLINPLDAPSQVYTGVTSANANQIHKLFDKTTIFVWSRNAQHSIPDSLAMQMAILRAGGAVDPAKLIIDFELANTTFEDAAAVRRFIIEKHLAGVILWRDHAVQGGACALPVNRKIDCIAYGHCSVQAQ